MILWIHELIRRFEKNKIRSMSTDIWDHIWSNKITSCEKKFLCEWIFIFIYI